MVSSQSRPSARTIAVLALALVGVTYYSGIATPATRRALDAECTAPTYDVAQVDWRALAKEMKGWLKENHKSTPILLRLSWHDAGTYSKEDDSGGSRGAQRFVTGESQHGANAGLHIARGMVQMFKESYPAVGIADLWALMAVLAIEEAGGPRIGFRAGRSDIKSAKECVEEGRLPDGDKGASHVRKVFNRMGFTDQEIVALSGGHTLGSCHADRSGFEGPWTDKPLTFDNGYYSLLLECDWVRSKAQGSGQPQMACADKPDLMMLTTDYALVEDPKLKTWVDAYAADNAKFTADFAAAFQKLQENGHHALQDVEIHPPLCNCGCGSAGQCGVACSSCECEGCAPVKPVCNKGCGAAGQCGVSCSPCDCE